jgi:hypothetical protein
MVYLPEGSCARCHRFAFTAHDKTLTDTTLTFGGQRAAVTYYRPPPGQSMSPRPRMAPSTMGVLFAGLAAVATFLFDERKPMPGTGHRV